MENVKAKDTKCSYLFAPGKIGGVEVKNRIVMPAMGTNMSDQGIVNTAIINHYTRRAQGGVGLIIVEVTCVDAPLGLNTPDMLRIDDDTHIKPHKALTESVHRQGAKVFLQLSHTGRGAKPDVTGSQPVGPSDVPMPYSFMMGLKGVKPRALTIEEIKEIENRYAEAALRAKHAGYDGVEIHSTGYYLGQQFLSKQANTRTDEYGGSKQNRVRFLVNIIQKTKRLCGDDFPVIVKLSVMELGQYGGISLFDGLYYAYAAQNAGADALEVLAGAWNETAKKSDVPETGQGKGLTFPLCSLLRKARAIGRGSVNPVFGKKAITIPLIGGGRVFEPELAENALRADKCDFVYMGRGILAEPDLVNLMRDGRFEYARPCIGCNQCINEQLQYRRVIGCAGCAVIGLDDNDYTIPKAENKENIVVVGGGPAGLEAARVAGMRGHKVTLLEQESRLGGQVNLAVIPPYKQNIIPLPEYYKKQLDLYGVEVRLSEKATKSALEALNPDAVIFATGSSPALIPIKGSHKPVVKEYRDVLKGHETGNDVVIIGGGTIGCELAEFLARKGKKVTVIELADEIAVKMAKTAQTVLKGHLDHLGVNVHLLSKVTEIADDHVKYVKDNEQMSVKADTVILCIGDKPNNTLYEECKKSFKKVYNIGDCDVIGDIRLAVRAGYEAGMKV